MTWANIEPETVYVYKAELERLRRIEAAARLHVDAGHPQNSNAVAALRAALEPEGSAPKPQWLCAEVLPDGSLCREPSHPIDGRHDDHAQPEGSAQG